MQIKLPTLHHFFLSFFNNSRQSVVSYHQRVHSRRNQCCCSENKRNYLLFYCVLCIFECFCFTLSPKRRRSSRMPVVSLNAIVLLLPLRGSGVDGGDSGGRLNVGSNRWWSLSAASTESKYRCAMPR